MTGFTISRTVDAPIERVFELSSDFAHAHERVAGIKSMEMLTEGPPGVGTRFRETRVMFGKEATEEMEVTAFDPPRSYTLFCENHGCRYETEVRFREVAGKTEMEMTFEATPLTMAAKMMGVLMKPMLKACKSAVEKDMDDIKAAAESPVPSA